MKRRLPPGDLSSLRQTPPSSGPPRVVGQRACAALNAAHVAARNWVFARAGCLAAYGLFLALACALLWPVVFRGEVLLPLDYVGVFYPWQIEAPGAPSPDKALPWNALLADSVLQYLPWRQFARESLRSGFIPLWNPHQFCGTPFVANSQSAVFYPPNTLFWLLPAAYAFGASAVLHLFLAGAFTYLYLRGRGLGRFAAAVGGISFELCGFVVAWLELPTAVNVAVWLPLALHLYERGRAGTGWRRGLPAVFPLAMILLAGHPQFALYSLLAFAAYALAHPPSRVRRGELPRLRARLAGLVPCALVPLGIAGLLAAPQILPMLELSRLSHRAGAPLLSAGAESYRLQALPFWAAVAVLIPGFFGSPGRGDHWGPANYAEFAGYTGVVTALLALAALLGLSVPAWRRRWLDALPQGSGRHIAFLAALAVAAALASFRNPVGEGIHALVPGLGRFGSPGRMLYLSSLAVALLAGFGAHGLAAARMPACHVLAAGAMLALLGAGAWLAAAAGSAHSAGVALADIAASTGGPASRFLGLVVLGTGVLALWVRGFLSPGLARGLLLALVAGDLLAASAGLVPTSPAGLAYPSTPTLDRLRHLGPEARFLALTPRWSLDRHPVAVMPPNGATAYGLNDVNGYDSLYVLGYKSFLNRLAGRDTSPPANGNMVLFDAYQADEFPLLACRYVLSLETLAGDGLQLLADDGVKLYQVRSAYPRAYVALNPAQPPLPRLAALAASPAPTRVDVALEPGAAGTLVLLDGFYPGWQARVDGADVAVERVRETFRGVRVEASARRVEFRYLPQAFRLGLYLSLMALCGVVCAAVVGWVGRREAPG